MITNPNIEPQTCKNGDLSDLENRSGRFIAQEKFDGHRAIMYIKDGKAYVETATCPDGICAGHSPIHREGESIVCLPHRVVITVISASPEQGPDIVV